jgi:hypothetical protein
VQALAPARCRTAQPHPSPKISLWGGQGLHPLSGRGLTPPPPLLLAAGPGARTELDKQHVFSWELHSDESLGQRKRAMICCNFAAVSWSVKLFTQRIR